MHIGREEKFSAELSDSTPMDWGFPLRIKVVNSMIPSWPDIHPAVLHR